jgi:hypothetical protein
LVNLDGPAVVSIYRHQGGAGSTVVSPVQITDNILVTIVEKFFGFRVQRYDQRP